MRRRSAAAVVQHVVQFGKMFSPVSSRSSIILWILKAFQCSWLWCNCHPCQFLTAYGTADSELAAKLGPFPMWLAFDGRCFSSVSRFEGPFVRLSFSAAMKTSDLLPSRDWSKRDIGSMRARWATFAHVVTLIGTILKKNRAPVTSLLCIVTLLC